MAQKMTKTQINVIHKKQKGILDEIKDLAHKIVISTVKISVHNHGKIRQPTINRAKQVIRSICR